MKGAGEAYVTTVDSFNANQSSVTNSYLDTKSAKTDKRSRIDLLDLKDQGLGEAHIFFKSDIVRAKTFYANPPTCKFMRLNQMIKVDLLSDQAMYDLVKGIEDFEALSIPETLPAEEDSVLNNLFSTLDSASGSYIDKAIATLNDSEPEDLVEEDVEDGAEINIFSRFMVSNILNERTQVEALVSKRSLLETLVLLLRFGGMTPDDAQNIASDVAENIAKLTGAYKPEGLGDQSFKSLVDNIINQSSNQESSDD